MTKRKGIFEVEPDISLFKQEAGTGSIQQKLLGASSSNTVSSSQNDGRDLDSIMEIIIQQMKQVGIGKEQSLIISDMSYFREATNVELLDDITLDTIYLWLDSMAVSNQTKLTRLKCIKAILSKCFNNGWFSSKFWHGINIKVHKTAFYFIFCRHCWHLVLYWYFKND